MTSQTSKHFDYYLLATTFLLLAFGIIILASVSMVFSQSKYGYPTYYIYHQLIWGILIGVILGTVAFIMPLSFIKKLSLPLVLVSLFLMFLVFLPGMKVSAGGASRWLNLGFKTFQPAELLKLAFFIYLSALLASRIKKIKINDSKKNWKTVLIPFLSVLAIIFCLMFFQKDLTTLVIIFAVALILYFVSDVPFWHILIFIILGAVIFLLFITFEPYRLKRIEVMLNPGGDPMGMGYQVKQVMIAIGSGGIFGLGLDQSQQKFGSFLPQSMSDSIFAVLAEEAGFIGCFILIGLFIFFLWRCLKIAKLADNKFSRLFCVAVGSWIVIQAFVNIGAMIGMPMVGIPLPFISYGGSHIVSELIAVGILLNISKTREK